MGLWFSFISAAIKRRARAFRSVPDSAERHDVRAKTATAGSAFRKIRKFGIRGIADRNQGFLAGEPQPAGRIGEQPHSRAHLAFALAAS
jgi:hypothetical protein